MDQHEKDYAAFRHYADLWASENPIKTNKLQVLLVVNGLLVSALQVAGGFDRSNWPVFLAGGVFSLIWVMSIGRTSLFQKIWQERARAIASKPEYREDPRFRVLEPAGGNAGAGIPAWLRFLGSVSSKYYLLGAPAVFSLVWFLGLAFVLLSQAPAS